MAHTLRKYKKEFQRAERVRQGIQIKAPEKRRLMKGQHISMQYMQHRI